MFLDNYLNDIYLSILYSNYDIDYLNSIDENNFIKVYKYFKDINISFINDIIVNYLEIFTLDLDIIIDYFNNLKDIYEDNYIDVISNNMTLLNKLIN